MIGVSLFRQVPVAQARVVTVTGGLSTGYDYFDRQRKEATSDDTENGSAASLTSSADDDDYRKIIVRPMVSLKSISEKDAVEIRYEPGFNYDELNDESDVNHKALFSAQRLLSQRWQFLLSDNYEIKDDADRTDSSVSSTELADSQDVAVETAEPSSDSNLLSNNRGRRRYTTNNLRVLSAYEYLEDSTFSLGYTNSLLKNDDNVGRGFQDYEKHDALLGLGYRFNPTWKMSFAGHYIRGLFDTPSSDNPVDTVAATERSVNRFSRRSLR